MSKKKDSRKKFYYGGGLSEGFINFDPLQGIPNVVGLSSEYGNLIGEGLSSSIEAARKQEANMANLTEREQRVNRTGAAMEKAAEGILPSTAKPNVANVETSAGIQDLNPNTLLDTTSPATPVISADAPTPEMVFGGTATCLLYTSDAADES